ncbi:MAG: hypothetical protein PHU04_00475 [Candidatus Peribacteraceae bacterium]|nr:hypothetical protein [Candidatus Peribacteraceae bacterium]
MTTSTTPEAEPKNKTLAQFKGELQVLLQEHLDKSSALAHATRKDRPKAQEELNSVKVRLGKLKVKAGAALDDKEWSLFLEHLDQGLENVESLQTAQYVDLHRRNTREKIVDVTGEVALGTAEVANHGVRALGSFTANTIGCIADTTAIALAKTLRGIGKGWSHLNERSKRNPK